MNGMINLKKEEFKKMSIADEYEANDCKKFQVTKEQIYEILDIGMSARQDQLSGHEQRSGKEIINEWVKENLK